jgi:hypothetical protein
MLPVTNMQHWIKHVKYANTHPSKILHIVYPPWLISSTCMNWWPTRVPRALRMKSDGSESSPSHQSVVDKSECSPPGGSGSAHTTNNKRGCTEMNHTVWENNLYLTSCFSGRAFVGVRMRVGFHFSFGYGKFILLRWNSIWKTYRYNVTIYCYIHGGGFCLSPFTEEIRSLDRESNPRPLAYGNTASIKGTTTLIHH